MADIDPRPMESGTIQPELVEGASWTSWIPRLVWLIASAGFLGYLAFGSIEARIWTYGRLFFQDRGIVHVWSYFGDHLPEMPASPLIPILYYLSLAVMVVGTVVGLWYFLWDRESDPAESSPVVSPAISTSPTPDHG